MKTEDMDYLDFIRDQRESFNQRVEKPHFYYQFALDRLNEKNCLSVLDVGCADGVFIELCQKQALYISGMEISPEARGKCYDNTGIKPFVNFEQLSVKDFDAVVLLEILEHLSSPEDMLKKAWSIADKIVIFTVPIKDSFKSPFHKQVFQFYDIYNLASKFTDNFKIYSINKIQKHAPQLNLFGVVLYKD